MKVSDIIVGTNLNAILVIMLSLYADNSFIMIAKSKTLLVLSMTFACVFIFIASVVTFLYFQPCSTFPHILRPFKNKPIVKTIDEDVSGENIESCSADVAGIHSFGETSKAICVFEKNLQIVKVPEIHPFTNAGNRVVETVPEIHPFTNAGNRVVETVPEIHPFTNAGNRVVETVPEIHPFTNAGNRVVETVPEIHPFTNAGNRVVETVPEPCPNKELETIHNIRKRSDTYTVHSSSFETLEIAIDPPPDIKVTDINSDTVDFSSNKEFETITSNVETNTDANTLDSGSNEVVEFPPFEETLSDVTSEADDISILDFSSTKINDILSPIDPYFSTKSEHSATDISSSNEVLEILPSLNDLYNIPKQHTDTDIGTITKKVLEISPPNEPFSSIKDELTDTESDDPDVIDGPPIQGSILASSNSLTTYTDQDTCKNFCLINDEDDFPYASDIETSLSIGANEEGMPTTSDMGPCTIIRPYGQKHFNAQISCESHGFIPDAGELLPTEELVSLKGSKTLFRGEKYKNKGTEQEALVSMNMALKLKFKKPEKAKKLFKHALAIFPLHPDILNHYGEFLEEKKDVIQADHLYVRALAISPQHTRALINQRRTLPVVDELDKHQLEKCSRKRVELIRQNRNNSSLNRMKKEIYFQHIYHTVAIEGNTLTLSETRSVVETHLSVHGKSVKEHNEILGLDSALRYINSTLVSKEDLTIYDILQIHKRVLGQVDPIEAGNFRHSQVYVGNHVPPAPEHIRYLMEEYVEWLQSEDVSNLHPIKLAALAHYKFVFIHPFIDGNGRTARLLMNMILMRSGYPPVIIRKKDRSLYYKVLQLANEGDARPFIRFIAYSTENTLNTYLFATDYGKKNFIELDQTSFEVAIDTISQH